ncbi:hypothetical protein TNCT_535231 [Trichonephila clavata]|uniref:Uncharacterized protein n=1 Tax=Trichonephila clavata TaxID=2740835 RepID=A0A8X6LSQ7_TRICU|nr:hypothetical protein TNCT_535231 [Trichonephila clavata]
MNMSDSDESIDLPSLSPLFRRRASPPLDLRTNDSIQRMANRDNGQVFSVYRHDRGYVEVYDREGAIIQSGEVFSTTNDISTVNMN